MSRVWRQWSPDEMALLERVARGARTIKSVMHLFPNRTYAQVVDKAMRLPNRRKRRASRTHQSPLWDAARRQLRVTASTEAELIDATGAAPSWMHRLIRRAHAVHEIFVDDWQWDPLRARWIEVWRLNRGHRKDRDEPKPAYPDRRDRNEFVRKARRRQEGVGVDALTYVVLQVTAARRGP